MIVIKDSREMASLVPAGSSVPHVCFVTLSARMTLFARITLFAQCADNVILANNDFLLTK